MDFAKTKVLIEKISRLNASLESDGSISPIERDLMLSYLRAAYDAFLNGNSVMTNSAVKETVKKPVKKKQEAEPTFVFTPKEEVKKTEVIEEVVEAKVEKEEKEPAKVVHKAVFVAEKPKKKVLNSDLDGLFEYKEATELSQKLSEAPISNLAASIGLNEKFLFINELFDGNSKDFDLAIMKVNGLSSLAEAREYLEDNHNVVKKWNTKEKKKLAKAFVKLIRRRYI